MDRNVGTLQAGAQDLRRARDADVELEGADQRHGRVTRFLRNARAPDASLEQVIEIAVRDGGNTIRPCQGIACKSFG
jgi:hypothetical protein